MTRNAWLIESDPLFRAFLEQELERREWRVRRAEDGVQAIEQMASMPEGSVVLLGASLALVSSMHVLRAIRDDKRIAKADVFYLSNRFDPALDYAAKSKAARVVYKPIDFASLLAQMEGVARRSKP